VCLYADIHRVGVYVVLLLCCCRLIQVPTNSTIDITFSFFSIQPNAFCANDAVTIYIGSNRDVPHSQANKLCGSSQFSNKDGAQFPLSQHFLVANNMAIVVFTSDSNVTDAGFTLNWLSIPPQLFTTESGSFSHLNYSNNEHIEW